MDVKYEYTKEVCGQRLANEIQDSLIITALDYITTLGNTVDIYFKSQLSVDDKLILDDIVEDHIPTPMPDQDVSINISTIPPIQIDSQPPFADPLFRTKYDATDSIETCSVSGVAHIDFKMIQERYIHGGEVIVENAEFGDWISAEVIDNDGIIPEAYRSALCENWPTVSKYIEKAWIRKGSYISFYSIDNRPLNAKINAGLYMRVTYNATNSGIDRRFGINYNLTKKL